MKLSFPISYQSKFFSFHSQFTTFNIDVLGGILMNKAKLVMAIYAFAAIIAMMGIGFSVALIGMPGKAYNLSGVFGIFASIIAVCVIFMMGFKMKRKFREQGLL